MDISVRNGTLLVVILVAILLSSFSHQALAVRINVVLQKEMKFPVVTGLPVKDVVIATKLGLLNRHWDFKSEDEQTINATFTKKNVLLRVRLTVSEKQVIMQYIDSKGLNYGTDSGDYGEFADTHPEGTLFIHPSYERWLRGLFSDIDVEIKRLMVMKGLL